MALVALVAALGAGTATFALTSGDGQASSRPAAAGPAVVGLTKAHETYRFALRADDPSVAAALSAERRTLAGLGSRLRIEARAIARAGEVGDVAGGRMAARRFLAAWWQGDDAAIGAAAAPVIALAASGSRGVAVARAGAVAARLAAVAQARPKPEGPLAAVTDQLTALQSPSGATRPGWRERAEPRARLRAVLRVGELLVPLARPRDASLAARLHQQLVALGQPAGGGAGGGAGSGRAAVAHLDAVADAIGDLHGVLTVIEYG
jgi:hypothetical protein